MIIVIPSLRHGGTNRSLRNLINCYNTEELQIVSLEPYGPYTDYFEDHFLKKINVPASALTAFKKKGEKEHYTEYIRRFYYKTIFQYKYKKNVKRYMTLLNKKLSKHNTDVVIAFQEGLATKAVSLLDAKRRIAWIRCDYYNYKKLAGDPDEFSIYDKFDQIVCVSEYTADVFRSVYPSLSNRVIAVHNLIDFEGIRKDSLEIADVGFDKKVFNLVSVGRMDAVKRFTLIPGIAAEMVRKGCFFRWYIIGNGLEYDIVKERISAEGMENYVIMLGEKKNPYPYIASANAVVCPSLTEACPNVVNEAKILHVPVIATDFPSASEFIDNGSNGLIVPIEQLADKLTNVIKDPKLYAALKRNISTFDYDNNDILCKIKSVIEGDIQ